jgi:DDE superfamily endonuclease
MRVVAFLAEHPNVTVHYTPTYSSWLNQVEIWFSKLQRDLIARGIFASRNDLKRKIMRYIRAHNANAKLSIGGTALPFSTELGFSTGDFINSSRRASRSRCRSARMGLADDTAFHLSS